MDNCNSGSKMQFDPGWNDPPKLSYDAQQSTPDRPRNKLNRRVAFPLSGNISAPGTVPPTNLPPIPATGMPAIPPPIAPKISATEELEVESESALSEVKSILLNFLEESAELGPKANDIKKRLNVMEEMWLSNKLNTKVHLQMKRLAEALRDNQPNVADEIHRALMVDHVSMVGTWMPGVKQLVHHCIARSELLAIDKE